MKILIIEDDENLLSQLKGQLSKAGYSIDFASDGEEGLHIGLEYEIDLAIIDLGLPKMSGIEVIKQLRQAEKDFPILILTARGGWQDKVEGLGQGADDYLVKPFHIEELLARVNALMRRRVGKSTPVLEFGPITVNTASQSVSVKNSPLTVTAYEYRILEYFLSYPDKVISKTELTEHVYDQDFDRDSNVVEVLVGRLRKKLDPKGEFKPIQTLRGQGYRMNHELK